MAVLPAKTLFKYRAMDYKSLAILLWSLVYWSNSLASKGWTLLALCPSLPSIMDHVIQSFTKPHHAMPRLAWCYSQSHLAPPETITPHTSPVPERLWSRTLTYCLRPFFWFTLIKETKVKDHVKWRIPLGSQWAVSACLPPPTPRTSMIRLWSRGSPRSGADSWLRVVPGWHLVSHCPLVYYLPRIWELVFFVQQRLNAAGFLSRETPSWWI